MRARRTEPWENREQTGKGLAAGAAYLDGLAVVDFDDVEVEAVNPFTRSDEIASLFVEIPAHVDENLRGRKTIKTLNYTLINTSAVCPPERLPAEGFPSSFGGEAGPFRVVSLRRSACFCRNGVFPDGTSKLCAEGS